MSAASTASAESTTNRNRPVEIKTVVKQFLKHLFTNCRHSMWRAFDFAGVNLAANNRMT